MNNKLIWTISIIAILAGLFIGAASLKGTAFLTQQAFQNTSFNSQQNQVELYLFFGETCPHCKKEKTFLASIESKYPSLKINAYEVYGSTENANLLLKFFEACNRQKQVIVPATFIGDEVIVGYQNDQTTGIEIETAIKNCLEKECPNPLAKVEKCATETEKPPALISTFLGDIDISKMSIPVLTVVLGSLDGFNPCAMWVLVLLLALLINVKSRKKMLWVGGVFILASGIVYYLIMAAWLNLFLAIGYINITRMAIGIVAICVGVWQIKSFMTYQPGVCKVTSNDEKKHKKLIDRIKKITQPAALPATFLGIVALAFAVNFIEFFCSAGLPAIYTRVLSLSDLNPLNYYLYLLLYIFFYMLDDIIVFTVAIITLSKIGFTDKYSRWSTLVGGLIILLLGLLLIFKPDLLMFA